MQQETPEQMMRLEASFAAKSIKNAILDSDMHNASIYLEQAVAFANSALAFARQASMNNMVERPPSAQPKKSKANLTLVHSI